MPFEILRVSDTVLNGWFARLCSESVRELQSVLSSLTITELLIATTPSSMVFFFPTVSRPVLLNSILSHPSQNSVLLSTIPPRRMGVETVVRGQ